MSTQRDTRQRGQMDRRFAGSPRTRIAMPIPNAAMAVVTQSKLCDYLLNPDHPDGGSKAAWFATLGYDALNWQALAADLLGVAVNCTDFEVERTAYGIKYIVAGEIAREHKQPASVLTVWIVEPDEPPRLITAYPKKL